MVKENEIQILKSLSHPNIVKMIEHKEVSHTVQVVLEYAGSQNLADFLQSKQPSLDDIKRIFYEVCVGVEYLHGQEICHRDIKLENIVVADQCEQNFRGVKLIDFGFACRTKKGEKFFQQVGTPAYMSPELAQRQPYSGFKVDIWALGILLYRMIYKKLPFRSRDCYDLYHKIKTADITMPKSKDKEVTTFQSLIRSLLQKDPSLRPTISKVAFFYQDFKS